MDRRKKKKKKALFYRTPSDSKPLPSTFSSVVRSRTGLIKRADNQVWYRDS